MTHLETERLIRKMAELLQKGGNTDLAPKLAGDYAAACHAANLRLQQCEGMIKAGDRHQAIQLAETAPNLLDLITVLEFRNADDWRSFCQQNSLPVAERIDARSVHELNECYALGITTDHPLYAAYRKAVLNRNDEEALKALQSITRLNPTDGNAASELARLDAKVLTAQITHLGHLITGGDAGTVVAAIEAIEAFGFTNRPEGEVWGKAEIIRCGWVIAAAAQMKAAAQWREVLAKLDFVQHLQKGFKLELPGAVLQQMATLQTWARGEQEKDGKEREFQALLAELRLRIHQSEEKDTAARYVKLPELRDDSESLHKVWRSLTDFTRPIPEEIAAAFRKRSGLLDAEIARRTAIRLRTILASSAVAVVVGAVLVWLVLGQMKAGDFVKQLQAAVAQRQTRAAERLIDRLHTSETKLLSVGSVNAALANAETFVAEQRALLANFETALAKLPAKLNGDPEVTQINAIADRLTQTRATLNALTPDLKAENEPRVQAFEQQWRQYLSEGGMVVNGILEQWITSAEKQGEELDYRTPIATATTQIATLSGVVQKIDDCEVGFKKHVTLRGDLVQRAAAVRTKFAAYDHELRKINDGLEALKKAATVADYSAAISLVASSEFSGAPAVVDAAAIQSLGTTEEAVLRSLLNATNAAKWAFINKKKNADFIPEMAMPVEREFFQRLTSDPAVSANHQHYRLWLDANNTKSVDWITVGFIDTAEGWKKIPACTISASANSANFDDHDYGIFSGQLKLSPTQSVFRVEIISETNSTAAFSSVGLGSVYTSGSGYSGALLPVLDAIKDSRDGSPVFRAHLFCSLVGIMESQPESWGLSFCPTARADAKTIQSITGGPINSGDWLVPTKVTAWTAKLDHFFISRKPVSYAKQAVANLTLAQAAAKDGLHYIGFIGLAGKPILTGEAPAEMWGYDSASKQPVRYTGSALPLSPLFALSVPTADYLNKASVSVDAPSYANALPPLFRATKTP